MNSALKLCAGLTALLLVACDDDGSVISSVAGDMPTTAPASVIGADAAGAVSSLNYVMPGVDGADRRENAIVMLPSGDAPVGGWPVLGWGHGTVGVADVCAPSASGDLSGYDSYLNGFLQAGYAVVAPDYEGLGTEGGHPYLHLDSEGRSLNYAVAAAVSVMPELSNRYALIGHSQGGHAVLGGGSLADENPSLSLVGIVALAPASQVAAQGQAGRLVTNNPAAPIGDRAAAAIAGLAFSGLILHGTQAVEPGFDLSQGYGVNGDDLRDQVEDACLSDITASLQTTVLPLLLTDGNVDSVVLGNATELPAVAQYLVDMEPGSRSMEAPLMIAQGTADTTVFPASTAALVAQLSAVSADDIDPELRSYDGATHGGVLAASFADVVGWLAVRFAAE